jgi:hypothetical protein
MQFFSTLAFAAAAVASVTAAPVEERAQHLGNFEVTNFSARSIIHTKKSEYTFNVKYNNDDHPKRNFNTKCSATVKGSREGSLTNVKWTECDDKDVSFKWHSEIDGWQLFIKADNTIVSDWK